MEIGDARRILSRLTNDEFVGREADLTRIGDFALARRNARVAMLLGPTRTGKSELLRKTFDRLFDESGDILPSLYTLRPGQLDDQSFARDFLATFLAQVIAFRRKDPRLCVLALEPMAVTARSAIADDYGWIRAIVDSFMQAVGAGNNSAMLRCALSAPSRAAEQTGIAPVVLFDDVHLLGGESGQDSKSALEETNRDCPSSALRHAFFDALRTRTQNTVSPRYLLTGLERPLAELAPADLELFAALDSIRIQRVDREHFERFIHTAAAQRGVELSDSVGELMGHQFHCEFFSARAVLDAAASAGIALRTFVDFERVYSQEVTNGRIGNYLRAMIRDAAPNRRSQRAALEALAFLSEAEEASPADSVIERMILDPNDAEGLLERLHTRELLNYGHRFVSASSDTVLGDYVRATYRQEVLGLPQPTSGPPLLVEKLKRAHGLMMDRYQGGFAARLVEVLARFDSQRLPACLFDEVVYEKRYRGMTRAQVGRSLDEETERITLPQIVEVEEAGGGGHGGISWRLFLAGGFEAGIYNESNEVLWIAALINSSEPVDVESLGRIDERIAVALRNKNSKAAQTACWYIGKEGFSAAATERIESAGAFRSTHAQLDAMSDYLLKLAATDAPPASEFELVIPIEDEAELIAARTIELIARSADFEGEAINQIKTAVIEACINAAEHGQSPDRRIHQRFAIAEDRIIITVSNKGRIFANGDTGTVAGSQSAGARGRGLNIIRALMDEVHFQRTDDGTSLVMTRFLKRPENP
ncbi:MAG TPA: ATP-binding protein [Blastocatellia bacterium]|nr:ATP-binding protein [Blastocatellia bacterium]